MKLSRSLLIATIVGVGLVGCGGGSDSSGNGGGADVCSTLRIAGGSECNTPPSAIVVVRSPTAYCSGTFITRRHVLTAAHCFPLGAIGVSIQSQYFTYSNVRVQEHPAFDPFSPSDANDVAIVTIGQDAPVTPVAINTSASLGEGTTVVTYGFGLDEDDATYLQRIDNGEAALKATTLSVIRVTDFSVDSLSDGSGDTCSGDSGGSLLLTGNNGQPGAVAIVRAGPSACQVEGGASDNTNLRSASVLNFVRQAAPGVRLN